MGVFLIAAVLGLPLIAFVAQVAGATVVFPVALLINLVVRVVRKKGSGRF